MPTVKSYKYGLGGDYNVEKLTGTFYKFTKGYQTVFVAESDIDNVEGFSEGKNMLNVKSYKYGLGGRYKVEKLTGTFYIFTKGYQTVFVPESDIGNVEGFSNGNTKANVKKLNNSSKFGEPAGIYHKYVNKDGTETFIPQYIAPESFNNSNGSSGGRYKHRRVTKRACRTRRRYSQRN
jgi:hypothetical protein